jgi:hypothetical protein
MAKVRVGRQGHPGVSQSCIEQTYMVKNITSGKERLRDVSWKRL